MEIGRQVDERYGNDKRGVRYCTGILCRELVGEWEIGRVHLWK